MGHNGCDGSQASGPWAMGSGYRFNTDSVVYTHWVFLAIITFT